MLYEDLYFLSVTGIYKNQGVMIRMSRSIDFGQICKDKVFVSGSFKLEILYEDLYL